MSATPPNARARDVVGWAKVCGARVTRGSAREAAHGGAAAQNGIPGRWAHGAFWNDDDDTLTCVGGTSACGARAGDRTCTVIKFGACDDARDDARRRG